MLKYLQLPGVLHSTVPLVGVAAVFLLRTLTAIPVCSRHSSTALSSTYAGQRNLDVSQTMQLCGISLNSTSCITEINTQNQYHCKANGFSHTHESVSPMSK